MIVLKIKHPRFWWSYRYCISIWKSGIKNGCNSGTDILLNTLKLMHK